MTTPREDAIAAQPCEFVPAHEPWTCRVHHGVRTSLDEPQCDAIRPAKPLTPGQLANLYEADAQGRVPHNRYLVRGLLATLAALDAAVETPDHTPWEPEDGPPGIRCTCGADWGPLGCERLGAEAETPDPQRRWHRCEYPGCGLWHDSRDEVTP